MPAPLFVSDLDGTLLQSDGSLSPFALETLHEFQHRKIGFTVASGRNFSSIRRALGEARLALPIISSDGALISSFDSPEPIHVFAMEEGPLESVFAELTEEGFHPILDHWDGQENVMLSEGPQNFVEEWFHEWRLLEKHYRWKHEAGLQVPAKGSSISITILDRPEWILPLRDDIDERYGEWFKTDTLILRGIDDGAALWIQHKDARKENALEILSERLHCPGDQVYVFGDELNDLGMFGREWHGVAVQNARDEVKAKAREVIGPHSDDAVLKYVLKSCS